MYTNYIVAANRKHYMKNKKSLQKYVGCILCGIAKNKKGVIKKVLYEDKSMMVIMNAFPYNVGHVQVVPTRHVKSLEDLTEREYSHMFNLIRKSVKMIKKTFSPIGFNIGINMGGEAVGASINHLHVQIVPRYIRDAGFMEITASTKVMTMSLDDAYDLLKKHAHLLKK